MSTDRLETLFIAGEIQAAMERDGNRVNEAIDNVMNTFAFGDEQLNGECRVCDKPFVIQEGDPNPEDVCYSCFDIGADIAKDEPTIDSHDGEWKNDGHRW